MKLPADSALKAYVELVSPTDTRPAPSVEQLTLHLCNKEAALLGAGFKPERKLEIARRVAAMSENERRDAVKRWEKLPDVVVWEHKHAAAVDTSDAACTARLREKYGDMWDTLSAQDRRSLVDMDRLAHQPSTRITIADEAVVKGIAIADMPAAMRLAHHYQTGGDKTK